VSSRSRLSPETARRVREFLYLNRRRIRGGSCLSAKELERWTELRWQIEESMNGPAPENRPRRKTLRVPSNLHVECSDPASHELGSAKEISEGGLFLVTERPIAVGTPLHLRLIGDRGEVVEVEGAVVWSRLPGQGDPPPGIGVEFLDLDEKQREAVAYLVEEALAAL
jgi:uncharacterized protein (TIGR02266 family)